MQIFYFGRKTGHWVVIPRSFEIIMIFFKILNLKSLGNSYIPCLLLIITLCFTCGESNIWKNIRNFQNIMTMIGCKIFLLLFISLLTAPIVKNRHIFVWIYFIFLKRMRHTILQGLAIPNLHLIEKIEKAAIK